MSKLISNKIKTWQMELVNPRNDGFLQLNYLKKLIEIKRLIDTIDFKKELSRFPTIDTSQLELDLNVYKPKSKTIKNYKWWEDEDDYLDIELPKDDS